MRDHHRCPTHRACWVAQLGAHCRSQLRVAQQCHGRGGGRGADPSAGPDADPEADPGLDRWQSGVDILPDM
jgi:hypothetical protein